MNKNIVCGLCIVALFTPLVFADEKNKNLYIGIGGGSASYDFSALEVTTSAWDLRFDEFEDSDSFFYIFAGYEINNYLSLEAGYYNLGNINTASSRDYSLPVIPPEGGTNTFKFSTDYTGVTLGAVFSYNIFTNVNIFVKAGAFSWEGDTEGNITNEHTTTIGTVITETTISDSDNGTDAFFGAGVTYNLKSISLSIELNSFKLSDEEVNTFGGSIKYFF